MRPPNTDMKCSNCYFFIKGEKAFGGALIEGEGGRCHRYPPIYVNNNDTNIPSSSKWYRFPVVKQEYWCGEWKPGYNE